VNIGWCFAFDAELSKRLFCCNLVVSLPYNGSSSLNFVNEMLKTLVVDIE
jgi:hypothetical protein